ncbi:MAG: hypothetical protein NTV05_17765 [Acidobacteria bacterium]|nr:hypothetical protein [Acidobacteriota bacterium]
MWRRLSSSWSSDRSARGIALLLLVAALSAPAVTTRLYAADEIEAFSFLRSLWFDHDVSFDNEYRHFYDSRVITDKGFRRTFLELTTETGLRLNFSTIGCALLWAPFYAVADAGVRVARAMGHAVEADGYSRPYVAAVCYGSAFYGVMALVLGFAIARRLLRLGGIADAGSAAAATWAVWLGTPLLFYMYVAPAFTHAVSACSAAVFVWAWLRVRERWSPRGLAMLGVLAAIMAMVREQDAFLALGPGLDFAWSLRRRPAPRLLASALAFTGAFALTFLPQAAAYLALNGRLGPSRLVSRKMSWTAPHALDVLLSPLNGYVAWTPLVLLAMTGWVMMLTWRRSGTGTDQDAHRLRWLGLCVAVMALSQIYIAGSVESWTVAGAFGQRRFVVLTVLLVVGVAFVLSRAPTRLARVALSLVVVAGVWWNLGLMVQFGAGWMDRQHLDLRKNAYNTFVTVPQRLPEISYRYLFERQSFYRNATVPDGTR